MGSAMYGIDNFKIFTGMLSFPQLHLFLNADTVFEILKDNGIPAEKMTYKGMGNTEMINPYATTDEEKRQNMRVEIFILNN